MTTSLIPTRQLRAWSAAALSVMYGAEVPACTFLVEVSSQVNHDYLGGDPAKPILYQDFLPASAAGIFRSNLDTAATMAEHLDDSDYSMEWMSGAIGGDLHDPYALYEKAAS